MTCDRLELPNGKEERCWLGKIGVGMSNVKLSESVNAWGVLGTHFLACWHDLHRMMDRRALCVTFA